MKADMTVIGGGPAGSAAAIRLARAGFGVRLFEKERFPRRKLCGGFLSAEALPELEDLGVLDSLCAAGACRIHRVILASPSGSTATTELPQEALSVSRALLDSLLLDQARSIGVEVTEGVDGFQHADGGERTVIATGRNPPPIRGRARERVSVSYGIQAIFNNAEGITDQVELDLIPGGYVGLSRQEAGRMNVCALVRQDQLLRYGPDLDHVLREFMKLNPRLHNHLKSARRLESWKAVGPVMMGFRHLVEGSHFFVGDAACVVDPFVGEGMAMGLTGARLLADAFESSSPASQYQAQWHRSFDAPLKLQKLLRTAVGHAALQEWIVRWCGIFPSSLSLLTQMTRPSFA